VVPAVSLGGAVGTAVGTLSGFGDVGASDEMAVPGAVALIDEPALGGGECEGKTAEHAIASIAAAPSSTREARPRPRPTIGTGELYAGQVNCGWIVRLTSLTRVRPNGGVVAARVVNQLRRSRPTNRESAETRFGGPVSGNPVARSLHNEPNRARGFRDLLG